jgi:hypothetical protein
MVINVATSSSVTKITLANNFRLNSNNYTSVYINSNGTVGFNSETNTSSSAISNSTSASMAGFFLLSANLSSNTSTKKIYYNEDLDNKIFRVIYNTYIGSTGTIQAQAELILYLNGNPNFGNAVINYGTVANSTEATNFGLSFATGNNYNFFL